MVRRHDRTMWVLGGVVLVDTAIGLTQRLSALADPAADRDGWRYLISLTALVWLGLQIVVLAHAWRYIRRLDERAADREAELEAVASISHEWLWQATPDMVATYCSPAVHDLLGYPAEELIGRPFSDLVHPEDVVTMRSVVTRARREGRGWTDRPLRWRHADGTTVTLLGSALPVVDHAGALIGFRGVRRESSGDEAVHERLASARQRVTAVLDDPEQLRPALQPIVDATTGRLVGVEALARFADQRPPNVWFAEAHDTGLGLDLELLAVCAALDAGAALSAPIYVSINASPQLILDDRFPRALHDGRVPLDRIVVEITEHAAIAVYDDIDRVLAGLRERGLRLAVDDTGAGYASFHHVLRLRPDIIKLDRSLISDVHADAARRAFITAIVVLALELDATVTAEGVETAAELRTLAALGVDALQGYLLARPITDDHAWAGWEGRTWPEVLTTGHRSDAARA